MVTFYKDSLKDRILKRFHSENEEGFLMMGSIGSLFLCEDYNTILREHPTYNDAFDKFLIKDLEWYFKTI
jgi:hypothetical protein